MASCSRRLCGGVIVLLVAAAVLTLGVRSAHAQTPAVSLAPETTIVVSFPGAAVGSASASQNVLLAIDSSLTISSISVPQSQGGVQEFTVGTITGCAVDGVTTNSAGSTCTVPVTFQPAYPGLRQVPLIVQTDAGIFQFGLEGIGQGPQVALMPGIITTVAGDSSSVSFGGDNGPATSAKLGYPMGIAVDSAGNLYIADELNQRIRKVSVSTGIITTMAGNGGQGYSGDNVAATSAALNLPSAIALDGAGNLYIADGANRRVRMVSTATGVITTVAGGVYGNVLGDNGPATNAVISVSGVAVDWAGNLYIADVNNNRIRKVSAATGIITTVAGTGVAGYSGDNGPATSAKLYEPSAIAVDSAGNLYIADKANSRIREVSAATGIITTVAGGGNGCAGQSDSAGDGCAATSVSLQVPTAVAVDAGGDLYIAQYDYAAIRKVSAATGVITTVAGNGTFGYSGDNGPATAAEFAGINGLAVDSLGNLYVADSDNGRIRAVSVTTPALSFVQTQNSADTPAQVFVLANLGNAPLNLSGITPSTNFATDAGTTTCSTSVPLAAGSSCAVGVVFSPVTGGDVSGTLTLTDNALNQPNSTQQVNLNGAGWGTTTVGFEATVPNHPTYGQPVGIDVYVAATGGAPTSGSVIFTVDGVAQPAASLTRYGYAGVQVSGLTVGVHQVTASYSGSTDGVYLPSSGSTSFTVSQATPSGSHQRQPGTGHVESHLQRQQKYLVSRRTYRYGHHRLGSQLCPGTAL